MEERRRTLHLCRYDGPTLSRNRRSRTRSHRCSRARRTADRGQSSRALPLTQRAQCGTRIRTRFHGLAHRSGSPEGAAQVAPHLDSEGRRCSASCSGVLGEAGSATPTLALGAFPRTARAVSATVARASRLQLDRRSIDGQERDSALSDGHPAGSASGQQFCSMQASHSASSKPPQRGTPAHHHAGLRSLNSSRAACFGARERGWSGASRAPQRPHLEYAPQLK